MSVRELARRIDVSSSHVSQVERGLASFSVRALYNVVSALGISMDSLFEDLPSGDGDHAESQAVEPLPAPTGPMDDAGIVLRAGARPSIPLPGGTRWERLTPKPEVGAEFIEVVYPPSPGAEPPEDFISHSSREYGVVVRGSLSVQVGFDQAVLRAGDSIVFDSHTPHRFWNATAAEVRAVWFIRDEPRLGQANGHH
jgi:mannose-6-phosphate isomerase-like protein (cupin superfamily)